MLRLATPSPADAEAVLAIYGPVVRDTVVSFETAVPGVAEMQERISSRWPAYPWLLAEDSWGVVGYAYAGRFAARAAYDWSVETSIYVAEAARGRGVARVLYRALLGILGAQGYRQAMAGIALPNPASVALHESFGFSAVGSFPSAGWKLGRWIDVGWWQRDLGGGSAAPARPLPVTALPPDLLAATLHP